MGTQVSNVISDIALKIGVPTTYLMRLVWNESRGNAAIGWDKTHTTAGIAQISEAVWNKYSNLPFNQAQNASTYKISITVAASYLKNLYNQTGDWVLAMRAYNRGLGAVRQWQAGKRGNSSVNNRYVQGL